MFSLLLIKLVDNEKAAVINDCGFCLSKLILGGMNQYQDVGSTYWL
ncbi:hypothetical protein VCRA2117O380_10279 [Vibrio crassostreae]|nr:hypothetical protein VCRA2119O382_10279 [Vibrio crassostreae]CAK1872396.1 hypothetical protein VCRA2117O380_10279 [Vibrio crassostreae]CAK2440268.1 hypothetical protein VCRA2113O360_10279 [Vibrio crassostreae]CAK3232013.1 hypothetical protein VCRA2128O105_10167 [Vibrio crassostreae]CAK3353835.1 hypothetical protein VCRA2128O109_10167 [Vibrio crassostreae]